MIIISREIQMMMRHRQGRNDFEQHKAECNSIIRQYEVIHDKYRDLLQNNYEATVPTTEMAKGVSAPPALKKIADAEARKTWGAGFVKSIFLTSQWTNFKNSKWPYQVMIRRMEVDFIVKEGGQHSWNRLLQECPNAAIDVG